MTGLNSPPVPAPGTILPAAPGERTVSESRKLPGEPNPRNPVEL
jgi:hypothetical protein